MTDLAKEARARIKKALELRDSYAQKGLAKQAGILSRYVDAMSDVVVASIRAEKEWENYLNQTGERKK